MQCVPENRADAALMLVLLEMDDSYVVKHMSGSRGAVAESTWLKIRDPEKQALVCPKV